MAAETQYTVNTGMGIISTANTNLDGSGTLVNIITGASNGTLIKSLYIKALSNTTKGMIRFFVYNGTSSFLLHEEDVKAVIRSSTRPSFETSIRVNFKLESGWILKAATDKGESFSIIAEALNWTYYNTSIRADTTKYIIYNAAATLSTANSNLDGTGTMGTLLMAGSNGASIQSIYIKARVSTTNGMIRIFLSDGSSTNILTEIPVKAVTKSATARSFEYVLRFRDAFLLKSGWSVKASTEVAESFTALSESLDLSYPA